jgi:RNA polymerase sigma factor (sigma-70 family)
MTDMDRIEAQVSRADRVASGPPPFEDFYRAQLGRLVVLARGLGPPSMAEDVAQEAMLAAYRRWGTVAELERPDLWVSRVCVRIAVSSFRRRVVEVRAVARLSRRREPGLVTVETEEFWAAVRALPMRQGQAAALRFAYEFSIAEIAEVLACSEGAVKQHLSRARAALHDSLGIVDHSGAAPALPVTPVEGNEDS